VVEHEACAAHQVTRETVVDRAVIPEEVAETARRVDVARRIEVQRVPDVVDQEIGRAEIWHWQRM
jgi:hypothetical protein